MRKVDFRYDVLRHNVKVTELNSVSAPSISFDSSSEIKSSLSGEFADNDKVDWLIDEIQPIAIINGTEHPLGVYGTATYSLSNENNIKTISIEAYDRCWILKVKRADSIIHFSSGEKYVDVIGRLLTSCGIALATITPSELTLASDREDWDIGSSYLTIINDLLDEMSYNPIWFDSNGYAVIEPKQQISGNIKRQYNFNNIKNLCVDLDTTTDFFNAPNVFLCVCANADHDTWVVKAKNDNPASPLSTVRRGREIMKYVKLDNIASEEELEKYAKNLAYENMLVYQTITLRTGIIAGIGANEVVSIIHKDFHGLARESAWSVDLEPCAEMSHTLMATSLNVENGTEEEINKAIADIAIAGIAIVGKV